MPQKFDSNASLFSKPVLSDMNTTSRVWLLGTEMWPVGAGTCWECELHAGLRSLTLEKKNGICLIDNLMLIAVEMIFLKS